MAHAISRGEPVDVTTLIRLLVTLFCGAIFGYLVGLGRVLAPSITRGDDKTVQEESSSDESEAEGGDADDLAKVKAGPLEQCKLTLVVRTDLGMSSGKIAAQCSHATLACYKTLSKSNPALVRHWERTGQAKIALKIDSEDALLLLQAQATSLGICARTIQDAGRTQIAAGSTTVLGIGPAPVKLIDQVTGSLRLL